MKIVVTSVMTFDDLFRKDRGATQINLKTLRQWLKQAGAEIYDYQNHFKIQRALRKKGKT